MPLKNMLLAPLTPFGGVCAEVISGLYSWHNPEEYGETHQEETMKTPHAILIGLSLIAVAIFFKDALA